MILHRYKSFTLYGFILFSKLRSCFGALYYRDHIDEIVPHVSSTDNELCMTLIPQLLEDYI